MDNISHSMVGLAIGEFVQRSLAAEADPQQQRLRRRLLLVSAFAASNIPDLDLLLTPLLPHPLGYLLHHRGHTHTLLWLLPQWLVLLSGIWLLWPSARRLLCTSKAARSGVALTSALGLGLHLAMDYLNSYGLHPFHPVDSRWYYGDSIFIVEPMFWVLFGIPMALSVQLRWVRVALITMLLALPVGFSARGLLAPGAVLALGGIAIVMILVDRRDGRHGRSALTVAFGLCAAFVLVQATASTRARQQVAAALVDGSGYRLLDAAMTPFPTHPLCWTYASIESNEAAGRYRVRRGILSLAPRILPVAACPAGFAERAWEPSTEARRALPASAAMVQVFEQNARLAELRTLAHGSCHFEAWLRFARVPLLDGSTSSDVRYGALQRANFTTMHLDRLAGQTCPPALPPWDHPRADLLQHD